MRPAKLLADLCSFDQPSHSFEAYAVIYRGDEQLLRRGTSLMFVERTIENDS
jgi:hypothetical protein